jgi:formate hydrogenlyase subunit 3/multisubunit Na+/H+ antiporter MnhD subunit
MLPIGYFVSTLIVSALVFWGTRSQHERRGSDDIFRYPVIVQCLLLCGFPLFEGVALVGQFVLPPGPHDNPIANKMLAIVFVVVGFCFVALYVYSRRFFLVVDKSGITWRKLGQIRFVPFDRVEKIEFNLAGGSGKEIAIKSGGKTLLAIPNVIQDFDMLVLILKANAKSHSIAVQTD